MIHNSVHVTFINKDDARWLHPSVAGFLSPVSQAGCVCVYFYILVNNSTPCNPPKVASERLRRCSGRDPFPSLLYQRVDGSHWTQYLAFLRCSVQRSLGKGRANPKCGKKLVKSVRSTECSHRQSKELVCDRHAQVMNAASRRSFIQHGTRGSSWYHCDISR